ncbi:hypothetical protein KGF54_001532 [Candida jiufengensis]|uniref:uncharacterized protein n=1 Tax=Candida jiufengensis TaxID=497108 RepID=UPI0022255151|nr:uncharacterized protein KGF54_001532 [Candida jiufengensis]KAI5954971.1 hypothetical protein KGF54_001532 [Candida jiufengensis]
MQNQNIFTTQGFTPSPTTDDSSWLTPPMSLKAKYELEYGVKFPKSPKSPESSESSYYYNNLDTEPIKDSSKGINATSSNLNKNQLPNVDDYISKESLNNFFRNLIKPVPLVIRYEDYSTLEDHVKEFGESLKASHNEANSKNNKDKACIKPAALDNQSVSINKLSGPDSLDLNNDNDKNCQSNASLGVDLNDNSTSDQQFVLNVKNFQTMDNSDVFSIENIELIPSKKDRKQSTKSNQAIYASESKETDANESQTFSEYDLDYLKNNGFINAEDNDEDKNTSVVINSKIANGLDSCYTAASNTDKILNTVDSVGEQLNLGTNESDSNNTSASIIDTSLKSIDKNDSIAVVNSKIANGLDSNNTAALNTDKILNTIDSVGEQLNLGTNESNSSNTAASIIDTSSRSIDKNDLNAVDKQKNQVVEISKPKEVDIASNNCNQKLPISNPLTQNSGKKISNSFTKKLKKFFKPNTKSPPQPQPQPQEIEQVRFNLKHSIVKIFQKCKQWKIKKIY